MVLWEMCSESLTCSDFCHLYHLRNKGQAGEPAPESSRRKVEGDSDLWHVRLENV